MPASSIDTFLACTIMIILALSAMVGTSKLMTPYLNDLSQRDTSERFQKLASHLLLSTGIPSNWGQIKNALPSGLGLAKTNSYLPYELDIDKVTRLNSTNVYSLTYAELWEALGVEDVVFQIEVKTIFELSINLISNSTQGNQTIYQFEVVTRKSGMPISATLNGYLVVKDFLNKVTASTSSSGVASITASIPDSHNGTALMLIFARAEENPQMVSFNIYSFGHRSSESSSNGTFTKLSPLDYVLNASTLSSTVEIQRAQIFTFNYNFSLVAKAQGFQTAEYYIPHLLDSSPMIMVLTGQNGSSSFAEWVSYPQLPLQIGVNFSDISTGSKTVSQRHLVTINFALYELVTKWGGIG